MDIVDDGMELIEELLLLMLQVLELLEPHLVLPLNVLVILLNPNDCALFLSKILPDFVIQRLQFLEADDVFLDVLKGLHDHIVGGVLLNLVTIGGSFATSLNLEIGSQGADHVHVQTSDVVVVVPDVLVLLLVLNLESFDGTVLLGFNLRDLRFSLGFHVLTETCHLGLVFFLDLAADALELLSLCSREGIVMFVESVDVVGVAHLLLLLLYLEGAQILLQLTLVDAMFILGVLELDLSLLLHHSLLVKILEHQMLEPLPKYLDRDLILLFKVLELTLLVTVLGLLVLELFLGDEPEVVDSETLIVVLSRGDLFLLDSTLEGAALVPHRLLVLLVVVVVDGVGSGQSFLLRVQLLASPSCLRFLFSRHFIFL